MDEFQRAWLNWWYATLAVQWAGIGLLFELTVPTTVPRGLRAIEEVEARGLCRVITARFS